MIISKELKNNYGFDLSHYSQILGKNKTIRIMVPKHAQSSHSIPICYLLSPFAVNRFFWVKCLTDWYDEDRLPFAIAIPESGRSWLINDVRGQHYADYFMHEVIPLVETNLSNTITLSHRIIGGFSMGGAASLFFGLKYFDFFNYLFGIAGAYDAAYRIDDPYASCRQNHDLLIPTEAEHLAVWGEPNNLVRQVNNLDYLLTQTSVEDLQNKIYLEVGVNDFPRILNMNRRAHSLLSDYGINHHYEEHHGAHDGHYARQALLRIFTHIHSHIMSNKNSFKNLKTHYNVERSSA